MGKVNKLYITTPLYYVNARPHIGHAYTQVLCDMRARYFKQRGYGVFFMTGTDEHGEKIERAALEAGFKKGEEQKFVDTIVPHFKNLWKKLNIEYDRFIRTTDRAHEETVKKFLTVLRDKEKIYKKTYRGWFCTPCEMFWTDTNAADGICPDCGRRLERLDEENYFLRISDYQGALIEHINKNPGFVTPEIRRNEVLGFLNNNRLQDLCISRPRARLSWGVEIPFDTDFVTYVWFDALINYASGAGYLDERKRFDALWPHSAHVIGKDILRHHAIYWPVMLMAVGEQPPKRIFTHGWWMMEEEKMSKSRGNIIDPAGIIDKYGTDAFRYYLLAAVPFGYDGNFSERLFVEKYNNDLANDLGNLLRRTLTMLEKYFNGAVPRAKGAFDNGMEKAVSTLPEEFDSAFTNFDSSSALKKIWELINRANKYIEDTAPWKLAGENKDRLARVMYELMQAIGAISVMLYSAMPGTAGKIWKQLGMEKGPDPAVLSPGAGKKGFWGIIPPGTKTAKGKPLFPRIIAK